MMLFQPIARRFAFTTAALLGAALLTGGAQAANKTWDAGVDTTWDTTTTANWSGLTWTAGDNAIFGPAGVGTVTVVGGGVTARTLTFNTAGYTVGGGTITLNIGNINQLTVNQDATINSDLNKTGTGYFNGVVASAARR